MKGYNKSSIPKGNVSWLTSKNFLRICAAGVARCSLIVCILRFGPRGVACFKGFCETECSRFSGFRAKTQSIDFVALYAALNPAQLQPAGTAVFGRTTSKPGEEAAFRKVPFCSSDADQPNPSSCPA
jgi:hypothetical protein